jgi:tetratricopeptide (TPR) repeat protein
VLGLASGPLPVVLFLDDLHWADSNTTDWLGFLGRRLGGERLLVVGGYNSEEREWASALRGTLMPSGVVSDFSLGRLDPDEIDQILRHVGESLPADEELAELLFQATGGNPFYLLETLHALAEATCDVDDLAGMMSFCLPDIVREAAEGRLSRLDPVARQVLEAGAVLGLAFTFDEVHLTGGRSEIETMDGLDGLVARQLLDEEPARYRFRHEVIRAAAYRSLGHGRRRLLHRRAGEALERLRVGDPAALSRHSEQADKLGQAAFYALEAGRAAKAVFAHEEARTHFDRALVLLETEAAEIRRPDDVAANQHRQIEALYERGWVFRLLGAMDAYVADLEQEARLAESLGDPATLAHLRFRQASAHRWFCRYERARAIAKEGLAFSQEAGDPLLEAYCLREIGLAARELGAYGPAQSALEAAQTILADLQETVLELHVMGNLSSLHLYRGEYEESLALAERALALCDRAGLPLERRLPLGDIGAAAGALGHLASAQEALEESLRIAQRTSDRTQEIFCDLHLGWLSVRRQRPQAALDALHAGLELAEQVGSCAEQSALHSGLAEAYRLAGKRATARHHAERALQLARSRGCAYDELLARDVLQRLGAASA